MFIQSKHSYFIVIHNIFIAKNKILRKKIEKKKQKYSNETHNKQIHFTMQRHIQIMRDVQMLIHRVNFCFFVVL